MRSLVLGVCAGVLARSLRHDHIWTHSAEQPDQAGLGTGGSPALARGNYASVARIRSDGLAAARTEAAARLPDIQRIQDRFFQERVLWRAKRCRRLFDFTRLCRWYS